jgi:hypothetical protein
MSFKCSAPVGSGFAATGWGATAPAGRNACYGVPKAWPCTGRERGRGGEGIARIAP